MYRENRGRFYQMIPEFWSNLYHEEYSLYQVMELSSEDLELIRDATDRLGKIYFKTAKLLRKMNDEFFLDLGFPQAAIPFLKFKSIRPETIISRFDFVKKGNSIKMLEFNSDTPTFIKECFSINGIVAKHFHHQDPNQHELKLLRHAVTYAIISSIETLDIKHQANIVFTAHETHPEDWFTCKFLSELIEIPNRLVPINKLILEGDQLLDPDGVAIDVLYRQTYPLEHLIQDEDNDREKVGLKLLELVINKKLALLNPISAFLLQSKAIQALIWGLRNEKNIFTESESKDIEAFMLPTYLEPDAFIGNCNYVAKPSFGREGDTVSIYDANGQLMTQNANSTYNQELLIYQKYEELPITFLETEKGFGEYSYLFGSFLIAGKSSAIGVRAGGKITANESYFLPLGIKE